MKTSKALRTILAACFLVVAASANAGLITWNFNPANQNGDVGSSSLIFTQMGFDLTVRGYDNIAGPDTLHELHYKSEAPHGGAQEVGLGLAGTPSNEFGVNLDGSPANYLQLDLRNLLMAGFTGGQIQVASLQAGEGYQIYGSNALGVLGTALGGPFLGLTFDNAWVNIPDFGNFQFISIAAASGRVLPVAFRAAPIPEMSVLLPLLGLFMAVSATHFLRRRRAAGLGA